MTLWKGADGPFELPSMNNSGNEHSLGVGDVEGRQFFGSKRSEDGAITADTEPPPRRLTCEILHVGIHCFDVKKSIPDSATH